MARDVTWEQAERAYRSGAALVQAHRYADAITELQESEDLFRRVDAEGHAFQRTLETGVSGLASTLFLMGSAYRALGNLTEATRCFETSLINERFERSRSFRAFLNELHPALIGCYEDQLAGFKDGELNSLLAADPSFDSSFRFPFSLEPRLIPIARLYELAPHRYPQARNFYRHAKRRDSAARKGKLRTDEAMMRRISISVWSVLAAVWLAYGFVVLRSLRTP